ncbi:hypothetical protein GGR97_001599 [Wenyingzhuangia aestuarii]|nr:hypothetical protein [Wenyingzhuangia aestuarii]
MARLAKNCNFAVTVHTTLPIRTAYQGVSFAFIAFGFLNFTYI